MAPKERYVCPLFVVLSTDADTAPDADADAGAGTGPDTASGTYRS